MSKFYYPIFNPILIFSAFFHNNLDILLLLAASRKLTTHKTIKNESKKILKNNNKNNINNNKHINKNQSNNSSFDESTSNSYSNFINKFNSTTTQPQQQQTTTTIDQNKLSISTNSIMTNPLTIPIDAALLTTTNANLNDTKNDSSQPNLSTAGHNYTNYYFLRSHLNQGSASSLNSSASNINVSKSSAAAAHETPTNATTRSYTTSNPIAKSASSAVGNYDSTPNYRNYLAAQDRTQVKLNSYLAKNLSYYDTESTSSLQNLNNRNDATTVAGNNQANFSYPSAYLQPELKAQLMSAQPHVTQASALLIQAPSYSNAKSKSVSF